MASIEKRPDGKWRARYRDEAKKEHSRHFARKADAQDWLDEVTASIVTGRYVDPRAGSITFTKWWADWSTRQVWAANTVKAANQAADSVTFADVKMSALRPSHLEAWVKAMSLPTESRVKGLEASTIATRFAYVHASLKAAVRDRVIAQDPAERITLPRKRKAEHAMTIPTPADVRAALEVAPDWFAPFIAVCAFAGLRLSEAAGLRLGDVDFLRRSIAVHRQLQGKTVEEMAPVPPKYGSERVIFVSDKLTTLLAQHVERHSTHGDEQYLFVSGDGNLHRVDSAGHLWRKVRSKAGLGNFTLHDLRHFFASGLIADGCDVVTVQRALGHAQASITLDTYSHLWPTAEDKTRSAVAGLMAQVYEPKPAEETAEPTPQSAPALRLADSVRTTATI